MQKGNISLEIYIWKECVCVWGGGGGGGGIQWRQYEADYSLEG